MLKYRNLIIIGTSHIAKQSLKEVESVIESEKPEIIAIELDKNRYYALTHKVKSKLSFSDIRRLGIKGFLFILIGGFVQRKLGKIVNVEPGSDMLAAIKIAKKHNISDMHLIDQDIEITARKLSKAFTIKEIWHIIIDTIKGTLFKKSELKKLGLANFDLSKVPADELIEMLTDKFKDRYPNIYNVLVKERNELMAERLSRLMDNNPDKTIVAIIGAGHKEGIMRLIKKDKKQSSITYSYNVG
jgi:pheromone shutdown-related protein TraB